jgi:hypothetical protein
MQKILPPRDLQGNVIAPYDLPPAGFVRWTPNRKAIVVRAVRSGLISLSDVFNRYHMTEQEFKIWEEGLAHHKEGGLKVTTYQARRGKINTK